MKYLDQVLMYSIIAMPLLALPVTRIFRRRQGLLNASTIVLSFLSLLASIFLVPSIIDRPLISQIPLLPRLYLDSLSIYFVLLVNLVAFFASIYTIPFLNHDRVYNPSHNPTSFHTFLNLFHFTMLLVPMVDNLVMLWIAVELTTIFSTILVRYQHTRLAIEASWKFMMITTTGVIFALLGTLFLMNAAAISPTLHTLTNSGNAMLWSFLARPENAQGLDPNFVILSFLFILIGYGTKAGIAPMHTWLPDGHGEAPSPVSALLSGVMLKSALYAILRFYTITNLNLQKAYENTPFASFTSILLLSAGLFSLILATPFILKKNKFKRILAYHSLEHMGIIIFGIGIGTPVALFGALLHTLNHALTKALIFLIYGRIQYEHTAPVGMVSEGRTGETFTSGVLKSMPISGTILGLSGLALVGSPPFNIFMSEFIILWAALQNLIAPPTNGSFVIPLGLQIGAISLFILTVTIIFGGLVAHLARLLLGKAVIPVCEPNLSPSSLLITAPLILLVFLLLVFGMGVPSWPLDLPALLRQSVDILQNGCLH